MVIADSSGVGHVLDMGIQVGAHHGRRQVGGVGQGRHLVSEISPRKHRPGNDGQGGSPVPIRCRSGRCRWFPTVPQEVPVASEVIEQMIKVAGKKILGCRIFKP